MRAPRLWSFALAVVLLVGCGQPQTAKEIYHSGLRAVHQGHDREALVDFNEAVARGPGKAALYFNRAMVNYHLRRYISAESDFTTAIDLARRGDTTVPPAFLDEAHYFRGLIRIAQAKWLPAQNDLLLAVRVYPKDWHTWDNLGYARYRLRDYRGAIFDFTKGFQLLPKDPNDHFNRGDAYFELGDYPRAISDLTIAIRQRPSFGEAYQLRGRLLYILRSYRAAEADFTKAIHLLPKAWAWDYRCEVRESLGNLKGALNDCNHAVLYYPKWSVAYIDRGWAKAGLGANLGALEDMRHAVQVDKSASAYKWLGWQLARMSAYHAAFAIYAHALELSPHSRELAQTRDALAVWLLHLQRAGIHEYGIGAINVRAAVAEHAPQHAAYPRKADACLAVFDKRSDYFYDCIYNGVAEAQTDDLRDRKAMRQANLINYNVEAYARAQLARSR